MKLWSTKALEGFNPCSNGLMVSIRTSADILSARLDKVYTFLEGKGYKVSEINEIMRLDSERG